MCNNNSILFIFLILKVAILVVLPIILIILYKKKSKLYNIVAFFEILLLILFIILRIFNNGCVANSNISYIKANIPSYSEDMQIEIDDSTYDSGIEPDKSYKTFKNKKLYYFNQNRENINKAYYMCNGKKIYMNSFGSSLTAFSTIVSTLYDSNLNPITLLNIYRDNNSICENKMTIYNIYSSFITVNHDIEMFEIDSTQVESNIRNGNLVLVELSANEESNFTCDSGYIIIYNIDLEGKYMVADPSLADSDFVCPYNSKAYGRVIKSDNMKTSWSLNQIEKEAIHYYVFNIIGGGGHD